MIDPIPGKGATIIAIGGLGLALTFGVTSSEPKPGAYAIAAAFLALAFLVEMARRFPPRVIYRGQPQPVRARLEAVPDRVPVDQGWTPSPWALAMARDLAFIDEQLAEHAVVDLIRVISGYQYPGLETRARVTQLQDARRTVKGELAS